MSSEREPRFPPIAPEAMSAEQRAMYDVVMAGPRRSMQGPFNAWLRSPALGTRLQAVGEYLRFSSSVKRKLNEFAILITAFEWSSGFEWYAHHAMALEAGLDPTFPAALREKRRPDGMSDEEAVVYDFATQLHRQRQVSDEIFARAVEHLGEQGVIDLIAVLGYYTTVSMTLNVARVLPPEGAAQTLPLP